jgi:hypothetical protein
VSMGAGGLIGTRSRDRVVPFRRKAAKLRGSGSVLAWISIVSCGLAGFGRRKPLKRVPLNTQIESS